MLIAEMVPKLGWDELDINSGNLETLFPKALFSNQNTEPTHKSKIQIKWM